MKNLVELNHDVKFLRLVVYLSLPVVIAILTLLNVGRFDRYDKVIRNQTEEIDSLQNNIRRNKWQLNSIKLCNDGRSLAKKGKFCRAYKQLVSASLTYPLAGDDLQLLNDMWYQCNKERAADTLQKSK